MRLSDSQTKNSIGFVGQLVPTLGGVSVRLYDSGTSTTFASGTLLFGRPGTGHVDTYIVTAKEALLLYQRLNPGLNLPAQFPTTPTSPLITNFLANVKVIYGATPWGTPPATPPSTTAAVADVIFKTGDSDWSYDVMLLQCNDAALHTHAQTSAAWDISTWTSTANLPSAATLFQNSSAPAAIRRKVVVTGFGETPIPTTIGGPPFPDNSTAGTLTFSPPLPHTPLRNRPIPPNALQFRVALAQTNAPEPKQIKLWPTPSAGQQSLSVSATFKSARGCAQAAFLTAAEDNSCVQSDIGGGAFMMTTNQQQQPELALVGVVSGSNGTRAGDTDFQTAFAQALKEPPPQALETLREFLPWPPSNDVVTLLTDLVDEWPLAWPPAPTGFFRATQSAAATTFITTNYTTASATSAGQALNQAFGGGGKATNSQYQAAPGAANLVNILHASAGVAGVSGGVTLFYTVNTSGGTVAAIQILAIAHHLDLKKTTHPKGATNVYKIEWLIGVPPGTQNPAIVQAPGTNPNFPPPTLGANYFL